MKVVYFMGQVKMEEITDAKKTKRRNKYLYEMHRGWGRFFGV